MGSRQEGVIDPAPRPVTGGGPRTRATEASGESDKSGDSGAESGSRRRGARLAAIPWAWRVKPLVWAACLTPLGRLIGRTVQGSLGANPIEELTHQTGWWALTLLLVTLAITPLRRLTGWNRLIRLRRLIGLFAFSYALLHFTVYIALDQFFGFSYIIEDIAERPYITVGFTGLVLLMPLAATSTRGMIRRLGGRRWRRLHRLVYIAAGLGVLHFLWLVKADTREPMIFGSILLVLLAARLPGPRALSERMRDARRLRRAGRDAPPDSPGRRTSTIDPAAREESP